jgi:hypothetical protein
MRSPEGQPNFCTGCPVAGAYVGELTADSISIEKRNYPRPDDTTSLVGIGMFKSITDTDKMYAIDQDGCKTNPLSPDETCQGIELDDEAREMLVRRVAQCAGVSGAVHGGRGGSYSVNLCRAWNEEVLARLSERRPQDS